MLRHHLRALALGIACACALTAHAAEPEKFKLTPVLLDRMQVLQTEADAMGKGQAERDVDAQSVAELARELDADPRIRALLAKHRISSGDYASAVFAMLHAGTFLAMEPTLGKRDWSAALAKFTPEQRANIELLRKRTP
ncbi:hypothetical protein GCM10027082_11350 [Comamonas humi]